MIYLMRENPSPPKCLAVDISGMIYSHSYSSIRYFHEINRRIYKQNFKMKHLKLLNNAVEAR